MKTNASAPSVALADLSGNRKALDEYRGKVVMLEFFASWCAPCQMMAPELQTLYERYKDRGLVVVAVSIDEGRDAPSLVNSFVEEYRISYPVLLDDGIASRQYGVFSIPTSFIIDKQGKIRSMHQGFIPDFSKALSKEIETLL